MLKITKNRTNLAKTKFLLKLKLLNLPEPIKEYKIYIKGHVKGEKPCRIDYCYDDIRLAIEIEGGVFRAGRHVRPLGYIHDMKKYNWLSINGWTLLRYTWQNIDYNEIQSTYLSLKKIKRKIEKI